LIWTLRAQSAGLLSAIVDQRVDPAEAAFGFGYHGFDGGIIRHVARRCAGTPPGHNDFLGDIGGPPAVSGDQHYGRAGFGQCNGGCGTDATACPGDDDDFACQAAHAV
jgi:hypothetical protein